MHCRGAHTSLSHVLCCLLDACASWLQVKADKEREVRDGHDGTWVAHPALVPVALDIFNAGMRTPNQVRSSMLEMSSTGCLQFAENLRQVSVRFLRPVCFNPSSQMCAASLSVP